MAHSANLPAISVNCLLKQADQLSELYLERLIKLLTLLLVAKQLPPIQPVEYNLCIGTEPELNSITDPIAEALDQFMVLTAISAMCWGGDTIPWI